MKRIATTAAAVLLMAQAAFANSLPGYKLTLDVQQPTKGWTLDTFENNQYRLNVFFDEQGSTWNPTGWEPIFRFGTNYLDSTSMSSVTGTVNTTSTTNGVFQFAAADLGTNGRFFAEILVQSNGLIKTWNQGWLNIKKSPGAGTPAGVTFTETVNWASIGSYIDTTGSGPIRLGTGLSAVTNADGSATLSTSSATDTTYTNRNMSLMTNWVAAVPDGTLNMNTQALDYATFLGFDTSYSDGTAEGRLQWNSTDGTLEVGMPGGNVNLQIGQEQLIRARNTTGTTISNGQAVAIIGAAANRPLIELADADSTTPTNHFVGIATEDIDNNANGYITTEGLVRGLDTSGFSVGDIVYLSTTAGALTATEPSAPTDAQEVGVIVTSHASTGILHVHAHGHKEWSALDSRYVDISGDTMTGALTMNGGNIVMSGAETVDGRDVSADGTTLDAVAATYVAVAGDTMTGDLTLTGANLNISSNVFSETRVTYGNDKLLYWDTLRLATNGAGTKWTTDGTASTGTEIVNWTALTGQGYVTTTVTNGLASITYADAQDVATLLAATNSFVKKNGDTMTGDLGMGSNDITDIALINFDLTATGPANDGGVAYRSTGEDAADKAFVWRGNGHFFESTAPQWWMIISSNGNVNIGSPSSPTFVPQSKLEVNGGVSIGGDYDGVTAAPDNGLIVQGDVGMGTGAPTRPLDLRGDGTDELGNEERTVLRLTDSGGSKGLHLGYATNEQVGLIMAQGGNSGISFWSHTGGAFAERARLHTDGKFGIGTNAPTEALEVFSADDLAKFGSSAQDPGFILESRSGATGRPFLQFNDTDGGQGRIRIDENDDLILSTGALTGDDLVVDAGGNVGIGTATPLAQLEITRNGSVVGPGAGDGAGLTMQNHTGAGSGDVILQMIAGDDCFFRMGDGTGSDLSRFVMQYDHPTDKMYVAAGGNWFFTMDGPSARIGIGEDSPGSKLAISGNATIGAGYDTTAAPANGLLVEGQVGVKNTSPDADLHVAGTFEVDDLLAELVMTNNTPQTFPNGTFTPISNWVANVTDSGFAVVADQGVITNTVAGRYIVSMIATFEGTDGTGTFNCHLFTNGVEVGSSDDAYVGWERKTAAQNAFGVVAADRTLTLPANCATEFRIEGVGAAEGLEWEHATFRLERR